MTYSTRHGKVYRSGQIPILPQAKPCESKLNRYKCSRCGGIIITVDIHEGVTPFSIQCRKTALCGGSMYSAMYTDVTGAPTFEWRRPTPIEYAAMSPPMRSHIDQGGLQIYPLEAKSA